MKEDFTLCQAPGGYGPYYNADHGATFERGGQQLHIFIYEGYNALGLIGTEYNGIGMLSVTDKRVVFDGYMRRGMGADYTREKLVERNRILAMNEAELSDFLDNLDATAGNRLLRYNPIGAKSRQKAFEARIRKMDKGLTKQRRTKSTTYSFMELLPSTSEQKKLARDWELLVVHRLCALENNSHYDGRDVDGAHLTRGLYDHMITHMGYIAHNNRSGFLEAQLAGPNQFELNLRRIAEGIDGIGHCCLRAHRDYGDLHTVMGHVAAAYLPVLQKWVLKEQAAVADRRIKEAKALLEHEGYTVTR